MEHLRKFVSKGKMHIKAHVAKPYSYQSLTKDTGDIRLLQLRPGDPDDPIECSLEPVHLSSLRNRDFETVSYCWGNSKKSTTILVDNALLSIPTSAEQVLRRFRQTEVVRTLWIDSVCINQSSLDERAQQVQLMSRIYSSGSRNLIWLGEDDGTIQAAIHTLDDMMMHIRQATNDFETFPKSYDDDEHRKTHGRSGIPSNLDPTVIARLCAKPWFSRLWVVQEAALSRVNLCHSGSYTFDLLHLLRASSWLYLKVVHLRFSDGDETVVTALERVSIMKDLADPEFGWQIENHADIEPEAFNRTIEMLQYFDASEPRDHVFGILALYQMHTRLELPSLLRPDYTKPVSDVFRDAAKFALDETKTLDLFDSVHYRESGSSLPSWVPRWDQAESLNLDPSRITPGIFEAHGGRPAVIEWRRDDPAKLPIRGIPVASIRAVSLSYSDPSMLGRFIDQANDMMNEHSLSTGSNQSQTAIATTLCAGMNEDWLKATADELERYTDLCTYRATTGRLPPWLRRSEKVQHSESVSRATRFCEAARHAFCNRKFFITNDRRPGLGPQSTQAGDEVAILFGGECPYILRPCGDEYELIGQCYVHGVMEGELAKMHKQEGIHDTLFVIR